MAVKFNNQPKLKRQANAGNKMAKFLVAKGLAKTENQATTILTVLALLAFAASLFLWIS